MHRAMGWKEQISDGRVFTQTLVGCHHISEIFHSVNTNLIKKKINGYSL